MVNAGQVLSKGQILDHVWDYSFSGDGNVGDGSAAASLRPPPDRRLNSTVTRLEIRRTAPRWAGSPTP